MGLSEAIRKGANLSRNTIEFITDVSGVGSVEVASVYALYTINTSEPCRFRLYDNQSSRDDAGEINRDFSNLSVSSSTALIADFSMSAVGTYKIDPVLFACSENNTTPLSYYRIDSNNPANISLTHYVLEDKNEPAQIGTNYAISNRRTLRALTGSSLSPGDLAFTKLSPTGSDGEMPTTYFLVSASLDNASHIARIRLYSTSSAIEDTGEQNRPFEQEITGSYASSLITDVILSGSTVMYFSPKIMGSNLENLNKSSLAAMKADAVALQGENQLYYIIENKNTTGGAVDISASLHVFALEE